MSSTPPEAYEAARATFNSVAALTAQALQERAAGQSYTLNFGPIVDRVVDAVVPIIRRQVAAEIEAEAAKIALGTDTTEDGEASDH